MSLICAISKLANFICHSNVINTFKQNNFNELKNSAWSIAICLVRKVISFCQNVMQVKRRSIESYHQFAPRALGTCNDEMLRSSQVIAKSQHLPLADA